MLQFASLPGVVRGFDLGVLLLDERFKFLVNHRLLRLENCRWREERRAGETDKQTGGGGQGQETKTMRREAQRGTGGGDGDAKGGGGGTALHTYGGTALFVRRDRPAMSRHKNLAQHV